MFNTKLDGIRAQLPAVFKKGYFNAGTNGPIPAPAHKAMVDTITREYENGRIGPGLYEGLFAEWAKVREVMAPIIGANTDEIALVRSTGEGLNIALAGLHWEAGDEIITTNLEHPCLFAPMFLLGSKYGVITRFADIGNGGGDVLGALEAQITRRSRVIAISHLQWSSGAIMPMKEICDLAHKHDILVLVDAAQSAGQMAIDVHDLGVDAYAIPGQKWLCGPGGTGGLYVANHRLADIKPTYLRYGQSDIQGGYILPPAGAARFEMGELNNPAMLCQRAALEFLTNEVDLAGWGYPRIAELGKRCHAGLSKVDGVTVITPEHCMAGIVAFQVDGMTVQDVTTAAYDRGYTIRYVDYRPGPAIARVSNGWWNTEEEVDGLVAAIAEIAKSAKNAATA